MIGGPTSARLNRVLRVRVAEPVPDIATAVLARVHPPRAGRGQWVRIALAVVAATELMLAVPGLLLGDGAASIHDARHLGSFGVAVSIGLLYVAWRPARAFGILPIVTALALTMLVSATIDVVHGRVSSFGEAHHVLEFSGLVLVWMLAGRPAPRPTEAARRPIPPSTPAPPHPNVRNCIMSPRRFLCAAVTVLTVLAVASPALAHIDPDPTDAQAGSEVSVGFTVQHGCDGSPTSTTRHATPRRGERLRC